MSFKKSQFDSDKLRYGEIKKQGNRDNEKLRERKKYEIASNWKRNLKNSADV